MTQDKKEKQLPGSVKVKESGGFKDRPWIPRIWNGMSISSFMKLLWQNNFAVAPYRWPMAAINIMCGCVNSSFRTLQWLTLDRHILKTQLEKDPVFIIGHWRSGTTMLHEILIRDPQFSYPDTYSCFAAEHFLLSRKIITSFLYLPKKRPMDNVEFGWTTPQEDEFALCAMGLPSPYTHLAFPNRMLKPLQYDRTQRCLDLDISDLDLKRWKKGLRWFIQQLTYHDPRQLVLKSPTHTARVGILHEMFPNAKFIHITRNPYTLYASTVNLWRRFLLSEAFQHTDGAYLEELVFESLERMYHAFFRDAQNIPENQLVEVRYEDLVKDKIGQMERIYSQLHMDGFSELKPQLEIYSEEKKNYKKNKFEIAPDMIEKITQRWKIYLDRYPYTPPEG